MTVRELTKILNRLLPAFDDVALITTSTDGSTYQAVVKDVKVECDEREPYVLLILETDLEWEERREQQQSLALPLLGTGDPVLDSQDESKAVRHAHGL